jgi:hypothetical protein
MESDIAQPIKKKKGVITFSPHQLPAIVNMPPWTDTSTKREHPTTNFTYFAPSVKESR